MSMGEKMMGESNGEKPRIPRGRSESEARRQNREYDAALNLESFVLFKQLPAGFRAPSSPSKAMVESKLIGELRDAREAAGRSRDGGEPDFFEALEPHERSNQHYAHFISYLKETASKPPFKKPVDQLSADEVRAIYRDFPSKSQLEAEESDALESYGLAVAETWRLGRLDSSDAAMLQVDLMRRRAERIEDAKKRADAIDAADKKLLDVIDGLDDLTRSKDPLVALGFPKGYAPQKEEVLSRYKELEQKNVGRRAEFQVVALLRSWARENGVSHFVEIEHTLPQEDHRQGIDFRFRIGGSTYSLDQKMYSSDSNQKEYQDKKVSGAAEKAGERGGVVFVLDSTQLRDVFRDFLERKVAAKDRLRILQGIAGALKDDDAKLLVSSLSEKRKKSGERGKSISERDLVNFFSAKKLRELGLLAADAGVADILAVTKKALEAARLIFKKPADFESAELIDQLKKALGKGL